MLRRYLARAVNDAAIAQGSLTTDMIDDAGGRDVLKAMPPIKQIILYVLSDDNLSIVRGSYFEEAQKQTVIDAMTVVAQTVEF